MSSIHFLSVKKSEIPVELIPELSLLMSDKEAQDMQLPPTQVNYFANELKNSLENDKEQVWVLAMHKKQLVGFGKLDWRTAGSNANRGVMRIHLKTEFTSIHLILQVLNELIGLLPNHLEIINFWIPYHDSLYTFFTKQFEPAYTERISVSQIRNHFTLDQVTKVAEDKLKEAEAKNFEIIEIRDGAVEETGIDYKAFAQMYEEVVNDMPLEDMEMERIRLPVSKLRSFYETNRGNGIAFFTYLAKHVPSGELAGFTQCSLNRFNSKVCEQGDTGVVAKYRGNGLGLTLKYQSLLYLLLHSEVSHWMTGNAGSNEHMLRINDILRYEDWIMAYEFDFSVDQLREMVKETN